MNVFATPALLALTLAVPTLVAPAMSQKTATRHPTSAIFWVSAKLVKGDKIEIDWNSRGGGKFCGTVTDVTGNIASVKITGVKKAGIGPRVGQTIVIAPSDNICSSCRGSAKTAKVATLPATRTLTLDPRNSSTTIMIPKSRVFSRNFDHEMITMPALGRFTMTVGQPNPSGLAPVQLIDIAQLPMGRFRLLDLEFSAFSQRILSQSLFLDLRGGPDNLFGKAVILHHFTVGGRQWEMKNEVGIVGTWDIRTGEAPDLLAFAGFDDPQIVGGPPAQYQLYGRGCAGSNNAVPQLANAGLPVIGQRMELRLSRARAGAPAFLVFGVEQKLLPLGPLGAPGCVATTLPFVALPIATNNTGGASVPLAVPNQNKLWGSQFHNQFLVLDQANALGLVTTGGGQGRIGGR